MPAEKYACAVDFGAVEAVDFHTHIEADSAGRGAYDPELAEATSRYFKLDHSHTTGIDELADKALGLGDHQVGFERQLSEPPHGRDNRHAVGEIRNELAIHAVKVHARQASGFQLGDLALEVAKVA